MPITALTLQRRLTEVGRIRIGQVVPTSNGKTRPAKLDRLRFTSGDKVLLDRIAAAYGGQVVAWTPANGGDGQWEVVTDTASVPVVVPPQAISQWLEMWSGGGCARRCDGETEMLQQTPCVCRVNDRMDCKPTTRLSVMLRDIEGLGVWRLESKGWNAAAELPGMAELLGASGGYVAARLYLKAVRQVSDGKTRDFMVPALAVDGMTPAQVLAGGGQLAPGRQVAAGQQAAGALEAGPTRDWKALARSAGSIDGVREVWSQAVAAGALDDELRAFLTDLATNSGPRGDGSSQTDGGEVAASPRADDGASPPSSPPEQEVVTEDADALWQQIVAVAGERGMDLRQLEVEFKEQAGVNPEEASAHDYATFLQVLRTGEVQPA